VYRAEAADGAAYFLKLRTHAGFSLKSLAVPRFLRDRGLPHIPAPVQTLAGALWVDLGSHALSLYPFIDGDTAAKAGLSEQDWHALGATLKEVHDGPLPPDLLQIVGREDFIPSRRGVIADLERLLVTRLFVEPAQRELAAFWGSRKDEIELLLKRSDALGIRLRRASPPLVLCHADLHTWNVRVGSDRQFWLVDWDEVVLAPKERDLMFVIGGIADGLVRMHETASFLRGYGHPAIDPLGLAYYRHAWAVQDIGAYAEQVFLKSELGARARQDALEGFRGLFEPGQIISIAYASGDAAA
jgi:spectinomycin phosphotransferase